MNHDMKDFVWDSPEWWNWFKNRRRRPSIKSLINRLKSYTGFIVFHGCRPTNVDSYYANGLQLSDADSLNETAKEIFLGPQAPGVTEQSLVNAIETMGLRDHGKLYVVVDQRDLIQGCGHYMIHGSERLGAISANLSPGRDYHHLLKRIGIPTVFRIRLPKAMLPTSQMEELADRLQHDWEEFHHEPSPPNFDCTFILNASIPAQSILDHVHPENIPDPHCGFAPYRYKNDRDRIV